MVQVREKHAFNPDGTVCFEPWLAQLEVHGVLDNHEQIRHACDLAWQAEQQAIKHHNAWPNRASSYLTGLEMAEILAELHLDSEAMVASILYRSVRESRMTLDTLERDFGSGVAKLVEGVLRMAAINETDTSRRHVLGQTDDQVENVRKMLLALIDDVRVALIKLAERTCALRAVKDASEEKRKRVAREVFEIYVPLVHRLGIGQLQWELEDLSFRYLQPGNYKRIAALLDERRVDRERFINEMTDELRQHLDKGGIDAEVTGRAKNIYSIWRKMQAKKLDFSQIFDIRAVRILVPSSRDCYATLGIVHNLWRVIPNEFDDYIATPKANGYQALHTAVIGPDKKVFEIQIRTFAMDEEAELGVCAHWRYKEGIADPGYRDGFDEKIAWLRQLLAWHDEMGMVGGLAEQLRSDSSTSDRIYVFTPEGHVVDMMKGATPLDFAYYVHTEVGNQCYGARVNGKPVPLNYLLQIGDRVEVLSDEHSTPSRDWLKPGLGYVNTPRAQAKLMQWFKTQGREQNIELGEKLLQSEFTRLAIANPNYKGIARKLGSRNVETLFATVGVGTITVEEVINAEQELSELLRKPRASDDQTNTEAEPSRIYGAGRFPTQLASCCNPRPGDPVVGQLRDGHEVIVHHANCTLMTRYRQEGQGNLIDVQWNEGERVVILVSLYVRAYDRAGLLRDVTTILADEGIEVMAVNTHSDRSTGTAVMHLQVEISSLHALSRVLDKINRLNNVIEAHRIDADADADTE